MTENENKEYLLAWYGDDFTGASAVMEVLTFSGVPSMLFLEVPTKEQLARYPELKAVGIASTARAQSPEWMEQNLPAAFLRMAQLKPELIHYKVCTTLDSSPETGSIGKVIELGAKQYGTTAIPVLIAAPQMRRYQFFGHLFAAQGDDVYRLDRHPVMSQHPVTPMTESDVAKHIQKQSNQIKTHLLPLESLASGAADLSHYSNSDAVNAITLDCIDKASETEVGRLLWQNRKNMPFVLGSQGVEFALIQYWRQTGALPEIPPPGGIGKSETMVTVSGSVSPTTAEQIAWSRNNGFACIRFNAVEVCKNTATLHAEINRVIAEALTAIESGLDPLIYSAEGPNDPAVEAFRNTVNKSNMRFADANKQVGKTLGQIFIKVIAGSNAKRAVVSGGDTSGFVTQMMGIYALTALAPTIPGASIFKAHTDGQFDGLELALKGGQMGSPDYFGWIRSGGGER